MNWIKPARAACALALLLAASLAGGNPLRAAGTTHPQPALNNFLPTESNTARGLPGQMIATDWFTHIRAISADGGKTWRQMPLTDAPPGGSHVALAPRNHAQPVRWLFTAGRDQPVIYRSGDFGQSWAADPRPTFIRHQPGDSNYGLGVHPFAIPYADPRRLYLGQSESLSNCDFWPECYSSSIGGINVSSDSGVTWTMPGYRFEIFLRMVVSPLLPDRLYAYQSSDSGRSVAWLRSDDAGQTWRATTIPGEWLALDGADPDILYAIGQRSLDGGQTWQPTQAAPTCVENLFAHPTISGLLFQNCRQNSPYRSYRSRDGGQSWQEIAYEASIDISHPNRLYAFKRNATTLLLLESFDEGDTWSETPALFEPSRAYLPALSR